MKYLFLILLIICFLICFLIWYCFYNREKWSQRKEELKNIDPNLYKKFFNKIDNNKKIIPSAQKNDMIFVSVASYRDDQCLSTVQNLAEMADRPELLRIVVCQQNEKQDLDCLSWCENSEKHPACNLIDIERLDHKDARGPCWARWSIQQKYQGEEFFLQIDAHTRVTKHWDTILKNQLSFCNSLKPCLTQYPPEFNIVENREDRKDKTKEKWQTDKIRSGLYVEKFGHEGFTRIQSDWDYNKKDSPYISKAWAAGFSFSSGNFIKEVPYDFYTPFLFFGEEMDITIRGYTNGWRFFSPTVSCLFTNYSRQHRKTFWENKDQKPCEILSRFRIYHRLGYIKEDEIPEEYRFILIDQIPLGKHNSIQEYCDFAGINIKNEKLN